MHEIFVVTIPHTGTHFIFRLLHERMVKNKDYLLRACHAIRERNEANYFPGPGQILVVTLRDPKATWRSWTKRNRHPDPERRLMEFVASWKRLNAFCESNEDVFLVPIDTPDRQTYLDALCERLGIPRETEWKPANASVYPPDFDPEVPDLSEIYQIPLAKRFYANP